MYLVEVLKNLKHYVIEYDSIMAKVSDPHYLEEFRDTAKAAHDLALFASSNWELIWDIVNEKMNMISCGITRRKFCDTGERYYNMSVMAIEKIISDMDNLSIDALTSLIQCINRGHHVWEKNACNVCGLPKKYMSKTREHITHLRKLSAKETTYKIIDRGFTDTGRRLMELSKTERAKTLNSLYDLTTDELRSLALCSGNKHAWDNGKKCNTCGITQQQYARLHRVCRVITKQNEHEDNI